MKPEPLPGGRFARPVRDGGTVTRTAGPAAVNVHALLEHLEHAGFEQAPRLLGVSDDRRYETLTYLPGTCPQPPLPAPVRSEQALRSIARTIRALHDATAGFVAPEPGRWAPQESITPAVVDCVGHGDLAPWNLVFDGAQVTGIIDFDTAGPSNRAYDLAYAAHHFVPFHPTEDLPGWGWDHEPDRARRLRIFAAAYDPQLRPELLVDYAAIRLLGMASHIEQHVHDRDPAYQAHGEHAAGYRRAAAFLLTNRDRLLAPPRPSPGPVEAASGQRDSGEAPCSES
jgi:phosphotransferase family enzyme